MNLESLFDDLAAASLRMSAAAPTLEQLQPVGFENVTFGRDYFSGIVAGSTIWRLTRFFEAIPTRPGRSEVANKNTSQEAENLVGLWLRIEANTSYRGQLLAVDHRTLIFREACIPISAIRHIEVHAVDNPAD